ncbi:hypothetical protein VTH06DRAFT_4648 [Thermothelomyces fergusii]
MLLFKEDITY